MLKPVKSNLGYTEHRVNNNMVIVTNRSGDSLIARVINCKDTNTNMYHHLLIVESTIHPYSVREEYITTKPNSININVSYSASAPHIVFIDETANMRMSFQHTKKIYNIDSDTTSDVHIYRDMLEAFIKRNTLEH